MSPIAYLFCGDDEPCDIPCIRKSEAEAGINDTHRLCVLRYSELNVTRLDGMGRRQPPRGSGPCVIQIINGERHAFTDQRFTEWIEEYTEYLGSQCSASDITRTHIRSTMGAGKIKVSEVLGGMDRAVGGREEPAQVSSQKPKVSAHGSQRPNVGACSASIQLMEPDCFLEEFAQDGKR
jgi:hypothetical protein